MLTINTHFDLFIHAQRSRSFVWGIIYVTKHYFNKLNPYRGRKWAFFPLLQCRRLLALAFCAIFIYFSENEKLLIFILISNFPSAFDCALCRFSALTLVFCAGHPSPPHSSNIYSLSSQAFVVEAQEKNSSNVFCNFIYFFSSLFHCEN